MLKIDLFENIENNEILELLKCTGIKTKVYKKDSYVLRNGSKIASLGIVLEGSIKIIKNFNQKKTVIENLAVNDIFGHNIVCLGINKSPVDIVAQTNCEILYVPFEKVITPCTKLCPYHLQLIRNIMKMISGRNSLLDSKIDIIGQKTTREKILMLLEKYKIDGKPFTIPYSREEMAKFLCVDRSAMSRELCRMRDDGILRFKKNCFELLVP